MIYRDLSKVEGSNKGEEAPRTNSGAVTALGLRNEGRRALGDWSTEGAVVLSTGRHDHCWDLIVEAGRNSIPPPATPHPPLLPLDKPQEKPGGGAWVMLSERLSSYLRTQTRWRGPESGWGPLLVLRPVQVAKHVEISSLLA